MIVTAIPCLNDNYAYLVECQETNARALVDASETAPIVAGVGDKTFGAIWSTHHHFDHVGGNEEVAAHFKVREIVGHVSDRGRIPGQTRFVEDAETFALGSLHVRVLHIPGHTLGAVGYLVTDTKKGESAIFTGDTLFLAGCGRMFEGTPPMMNRSLAKLAALPPATRVYCGHEYTEANLRFAAHVEPDNTKITARSGRPSPTVPGTIGEELETNPFFRVRSATIRKTLGISAAADDAEAFGAIRSAKDSYK